MLTQVEADELLKMAKVFLKSETLAFPSGLDISYDLVSVDRKEHFILDLSRSSIKFSKLKFQNRARKTIVVARLDINGPPHTNPDGKRINGTHIHFYREGYESRWAFELDLTKFTDLNSPEQVYFDFCKLCNIEPTPAQGSLI
jgi:hypothetical protein